jgi:hypothetical protein
LQYSNAATVSGSVVLGGCSSVIKLCTINSENTIKIKFPEKPEIPFIVQRLLYCAP